MSYTNLSHLFTLPVKNQLGEGVLWDDSRRVILWTDIEAAKLFQFNVSNKFVESINLPERLGCFGLTTRSNVLICAFESGFALLDITSKEVAWLIKIEADNPGTRMNDGRVDRNGVFWAGTMVEDESIATGKASLYSIDQEFKVAHHLSGLNISNGLCWSPDGKTTYFADSPTHKIVSFESNFPSNKLGEPKCLVETAQEHFPDGSCVDKYGNIWNALWGSKQVNCFSPEGKVLFTLTLPVSQPSCVSIGGPNMDWLIITSASQLTDAQQLDEPEAGNLFVYQLDESLGLLEPRFNLT